MYSGSILTVLHKKRLNSEPVVRCASPIALTKTRYQDIELFTATQIHPVFCLACPTQYTGGRGLSLWAWPAPGWGCWTEMLCEHPLPSAAISAHTGLASVAHSQGFIWSLSQTEQLPQQFPILDHQVLPLQGSEGRRWSGSALLLALQSFQDEVILLPSKFTSYAGAVGHRLGMPLGQCPGFFLRTALHPLPIRYLHFSDQNVGLVGLCWSALITSSQGLFFCFVLMVCRQKEGGNSFNQLCFCVPVICR